MKFTHSPGLSGARSRLLRRSQLLRVYALIDRAPIVRKELRSLQGASIRWLCGLLSTSMEVIVKAKKPLNTEKPETSKMPDLRHGVHGSLMIKGVDAGQSSQTSQADLKIASPDLEVPAGQTTHE
jgi:hypothetical protein